MPQSLSNVLLHVVFSTKHRQPFLKEACDRDAMTGYLIGTLQNIKCPSLIVGVVSDHVHILCNLSRTMSIAQLVEEVKTSSSARIKEQGPALHDFYWQSGYGAFSVSQSNMEQVKRYIENQEEHHRTRTFQEELRLLLERHKVEYDERYVWDCVPSRPFGPCGRDFGARRPRAGALGFRVKPLRGECRAPLSSLQQLESFRS